MSTDDTHKVSRTVRQAVGFVVSDLDAEPLARDIVRAIDAGYEVFVTYSPDVRSRDVEYVEDLGAELVHPQRPVWGEEALYNYLEEEANREGIRHFKRYDQSGDILPKRSEPVHIGSVQPPDEEEGYLIAGIPAYNEASTVASVVRETRRHVDEVIVVDDGSDDETVEEARQAGATVVQHETNLGYGTALNTVFREANRRNAEHLVVLDADGQHDPSDISKLVERQRETEAEIVIGSRFLSDSTCNAPLYRLFGLCVINVLTNVSMGVLRRNSWISDTQSGLRIYDRRAISSLANDHAIGEEMSASTDVLYHAHHNDYDVDEAGVTIDYEVENASSHNPLTHGFTLVKNILKTVERERPLLALGIPGFLSSFLGLLLAYRTVAVFASTGVFELGIALSAAFFTLAGILSCFTAIILHSVSSLFEVECDREGRERQGR